jgi:hypothetical protein
MLSRLDAARFLGVSKTRIRQYERTGRLTVFRDERGRGWFPRAAVVELARTHPRANADRVHGTIAAEIFGLFRQGVELPEIVIKTQQAPATVRALFEEYSRALGAPPPPAAVDVSRYDATDRAADAKLASLQGATRRLLRSAPTAPDGEAAHARRVGGK